MQLFVMRHGQTNYNLQGLCNADPAQDVHLTDEGRQQAQRAAEDLHDQNLELILVSELPRTQQTAAIVNQYHQVEIRIEPAINDIRSGFEDRPVEDYQSAIAADRLHRKFNDGESLLEHKLRIVEFLAGLQHLPYDSILVVAHEETLRVITAYFKDLPDDTMLDLHFNNAEVLQFHLP